MEQIKRTVLIASLLSQIAVSTSHAQSNDDVDEYSEDGGRRHVRFVHDCLYWR